jgi:hypothetical protein
VEIVNSRMTPTLRISLETRLRLILEMMLAIDRLRVGVSRKGLWVRKPVRRNGRYRGPGRKYAGVDIRRMEKRPELETDFPSDVNATKTAYRKL